MVVARDGVADGAIVVVIVALILVIPAFLDGLGVFAVLRIVLRGLVVWIVLSGLVYLIGRKALSGDGTFPGTMAAVAIGMPVIVASLVLRPFVGALASELIVSIWLMATLWMAARVALELDRSRALVAAVGGWAAFVMVAALFRL
jgi:hypothetical protein